MTAKPLILSVVTCDAVHVDKSTGKYYLLGVFSSIRTRHFPVVHPRMFWFVVLTDVPTGEHILRVSLGLPTEAPIMEIDRPFESQNPLHRIHLVNEIQNLRFEEPGDYSLNIEVDDEPLIVTSFAVST
mgnify:CR=1 FL=1